MQNVFLFAGMALVGIAVGLLFASLYFRARTAVLSEKLKSAEEKVPAGEEENTEQKAEVNRIRAALHEQSQFRAAAEEKATRIADLEAEITALARCNSELLAEKSTIVAQV